MESESSKVSHRKVTSPLRLRRVTEADLREACLTLLNFLVNESGPLVHFLCSVNKSTRLKTNYVILGKVLATNWLHVLQKIQSSKLWQE
jgi:hypothetical protein